MKENASFLEYWFDKAFTEGALSIFICLVEAYFIDRGNVQVMDNRLHEALQAYMIHNAQYGFLAKRDILHIF